MIRVNLIRDRVPRPPTLTERGVRALPFVLLLLYAGCAAAASTVGIRATAAAYGLERQIVAEERFLADAGSGRGGYTPSDEADITSLEHIVRVHRRKQHWGVKLAALQKSLPEGITVSSFGGEVMKAVRIQAAADNSDGRGLERIRDFAKALETNDLFTEGVTEVNLARITNKEEDDSSGVLEFVIDCPVIVDAQGVVVGLRVEGRRRAVSGDDHALRVPAMSLGTQ